MQIVIIKALKSMLRLGSGLAFRMIYTKMCTEFDKRTHLGARKTFPQLIATRPIMSAEMARAVCSQLNNDIVKVTPQVSDYLCPICTSIVWRPVVLHCKHALCTRCAVVLQRQHRRFCPLCRGDVVMIANTDNIDEEYASHSFPLLSLSNLTTIY